MKVQSELFSYGFVSVDVIGQKIFLLGKAHHVSFKEAQLMAYLISNTDNTFSAFFSQTGIQPKNLPTFVSRLREKLESVCLEGNVTASSLIVTRLLARGQKHDGINAVYELNRRLIDDIQLRLPDGKKFHSPFLSFEFTACSYGFAMADLRAKEICILGQKLSPKPAQVSVMAVLINNVEGNNSLTTEELQAEAKISTPASVKVTVANLRSALKGINLTESITAASLVLSDIPYFSGEAGAGMACYSFNKHLVDAIERKQNLNGVRTTPHLRLKSLG